MLYNFFESSNEKIKTIKVQKYIKLQRLREDFNNEEKSNKVRKWSM